MQSHIFFKAFDMSSITAKFLTKLKKEGDYGSKKGLEDIWEKILQVMGFFKFLCGYSWKVGNGHSYSVQNQDQKR